MFVLLNRQAYGLVPQLAIQRVVDHHLVQSWVAISCENKRLILCTISRAIFVHACVFGPPNRSNQAFVCLRFKYFERVKLSFVFIVCINSQFAGLLGCLVYNFLHF